MGIAAASAAAARAWACASRAPGHPDHVGVPNESHTELQGKRRSTNVPEDLSFNARDRVRFVHFELARIKLGQNSDERWSTPGQV